ncbi:hypothetical protein DH2020_019467 [Rehmannia glutinosa]|uniref:Retrotransposon Copia-like N-terminal domain-containing protein n=1 Tax=Rehmannia glutinosa TaxID=99300 RepID=A0ABR0WQV8_REHGL
MAFSISSIIASAPHFNPISIRLDKGNYNFWKLQVTSTVRAHGFEGILFGTEVPPLQFLYDSATGESSNLTINPEYIAWVRKDQFLFSWMLSYVSESMLGHISRCTATHEKGDLIVDEYSLKMRTIVDDLNSADTTITDNELCMYILGGLGPKFDSVVVNLTTRFDHLNLQEVQFALHIHEMRLQNHTQSHSIALH